MLLRQLTLRNFKAFQAATFDLAPITVLIGPNNAGKSTVLHALALLAQSSQDQTYLGLRLSQAARLDTGELIDLGDRIEGLIHEQRPSEGFEIALDWSLGPGDIGRDDTENTTRFELLVRQALAPLQVQTGLTASYRQADGAQVSLAANYPPTSRAALRMDSKWEHSVTASADFPWAWTFQPTNPWPSDLVSTEIPDVETSALTLFAPFFQHGLQEQLGIFDYVGPDRHVTSSAYAALDTSSENPRNAAEVVNTLAYEREVRDRVSARCRDVFGFGIDTQPIPPKKFALVAVDANGQARNAVNVGTGLTQLAWIALHLELTIARARRLALVSGFLPTPFVGVEEPELHLHPRLQSEVARLLTDFLPQGQVLCTTQSEHFLIALLQFVLDGKLAPDDLAVYFVESGRAERLKVDKKGRLAGGLRGFFEANEQELLHRLDALVHSKR